MRSSWVVVTGWVTSPPSLDILYTRVITPSDLSPESGNQVLFTSVSILSLLFFIFLILGRLC